MPRKQIYDEDLRLNLIINGDGLKSGSKTLVAELGKQERKMRELELTLQKTQKRYNEVSKAEGRTSVAAKALRKELTTASNAVKAQQLVLRNLRNEIGLAGMTLQQLTNHMKALKVQLFNVRGDRAFTKQIRAEMKQTQIEINKLTTGASRLSQAWERLALRANRFGTIMGYVMVGFYMLYQSIGKVVFRMKDLEDRIGGVRKLAKLTRDEVWELKVAFDEMGTRTNTDKLLDLSKIAGRLGVEGKENILAFVSAADKISVALRESLGDDVEEIMRKMGKLVNVFRLTDNLTLDNAMLRIGSVLNELDKRSAASAESILEYTYRLSSYAEVVNMAAPDVMGLAASLDALGVRAEMGSTQVLKLLRGMGKADNAAQFARILGLQADEYERMLKNDPNEMFLGILELMSGDTDSMIQMEKLMKDIGVDGQRLVQVLGPMINNLDKVRDQQAIANEEFEKGTSVLMEYEIMNQTFGAEIDKQTKRLRSMADLLYKKMMPAVLSIYKGFMSFLVSIKELKMWIVDHARLFRILIGLYIAIKAPLLYKIALERIELGLIRLMIIQKKLQVFWAKIEILWTKKLTASQLILMRSSVSLRLAYLLLHGQFGKVVRMLKVMAIGTSTAGVAIAAAAATVLVLVGAFALMARKVKAANEANKKANETSRAITKRYGEEKASLDLLYSAYNNAEDKGQARLDLIRALNRDYGQYLGYTIDEKNNLYDVAKAYVDVTTAMKKRFEIEEKTRAREDLGGQIEVLKEELNIQREINETAKQAVLASEGTGNIIDARKLSNSRKAIDEKEAELAGYIKLYEDYEKDIARLDNEIKEVSDKLTKTNKTDIEYDTELSILKREQAERNTLLTEQALREQRSKDWLNDELLKSDISYYKAKLKLDESMGDKETEVFEGRMEIAQAYLGMREEAETSGKKASTKKELDLEKLRIASLLAGRSKELELEKKRAAEEVQMIMASESTKAEKLKALEYARIVHNQNITDINLKFLDKQLADASVSFQMKAMLLELALQHEELTMGEYAERKQTLAEEQENKLLEFKKEYGILSTTELMDMEIAAFKAKEEYALLSEEEKQKGIEAIRQRYDRERAKQFKRNVDAELNTIKEGFSQLQLAAFEDGMKMMNDWERIGESLGNSFSAFFDESQNGIKAFGKALLIMAIDLVRAQVKLQYPLILAKKMAKYAAVPFGQAIALRETAVTIALIEAAFSAGKAAINSINTAKETSQRADGQYPVIGADDGLLYNATYRGGVKTGVYSNPTLLDMSGGRTLVGETRLPELVVDGKTFRRMRMNAPQMVNDIYTMAGRVPQFAGGNYPGVSGGISGVTNEAVMTLLSANMQMMQSVIDNRPVIAVETYEKEKDKYVQAKGYSGL